MSRVRTPRVAVDDPMDLAREKTCFTRRQASQSRTTPEGRIMVEQIRANQRRMLGGGPARSGR